MNSPGPDVSELLRASQSAGVLPLTSACNLRCVFCSNRFNPPGVEARFIGPRDLEEIRKGIPELAGAEKIVIGESATRICEGEPLTHPGFLDVIRMIRERFPWKPVKVTTNGSLLDRGIVQALKSSGDVEVTVSLNSSSPAVRERIMGDGGARNAIAGIRLLAESGVPFHGSVVWLPSISGRDDTVNTLRFLWENEAKTARVFVPGYTRCGPVDTLLSDRRDLEASVRRLVEDGMTMPVTIEPPEVYDLIPSIEGVIEGSPAARAGLRSGDIIIDVDGVQPESRHHAFRLATEATNPTLIVERTAQGNCVERVPAVLRKHAGQTPGFVVTHDADVGRVRRAVAKASGCSKAPVFVTSELGWRAVAAAMAQCCEGGGRLAERRLCRATAAFFGGNIGCAGLLTVGDIVDALASARAAGLDFDTAVLPSEPFDIRGRDLLGTPYGEIESAFGVRVLIC